MDCFLEFIGMSPFCPVDPMDELTPNSSIFVHMSDFKRFIFTFFDTVANLWKVNNYIYFDHKQCKVTCVKNKKIIFIAPILILCKYDKINLI